MYEKEAKLRAKDYTENKERQIAYGCGFLDGAEFGYNKANEWHYPSKGEYPEKGKAILLYTKTLGLIFGEFCEGYNNLWTSNRCVILHRKK